MLSRALLFALAIAVFVGCAHPVERRDWSSYQGPGAEFFRGETLEPPRFPDPLEPVNRVTTGFNHALIVAVVDPVGTVYRFVIPRFVRDRFRDFAANIIFPRNFAANLLQGRLRGAVDETMRFAVNSTVGLAGLWDPATRWLEIPAAPEDFGQVFATWGWRPSTYVVLPIGGPSTIRDGVGLIPDSFLDPATYYFPAGPALTFNQRVDSIPSYRRLVTSSYDFYDDAHLIWQIARDEEIDDAPIATHGDNTGAVQTLEAAFLAPRDPGFASRLDTREVYMTTTGRVLPYSVRMQPRRAPIAFVVPGLGAHRLSSSALALAEMAWERGFSVAIVSSALNFEFIERAASAPVPGHAPLDARDVQTALGAIKADLDERYGGRVGSRAYIGYSLGAFHGFFIAAGERPGAPPLFDRYLLIDPPVRLIDGMERLDAFFDSPLALPRDQRAAEMERILRKAVHVGRQALAESNGMGSYSRMEATALAGETITPDRELPFTHEEAEFLIGFAFRRSLQEILYASQEREDLGVLLTERTRLRRQSAYREIGDYSFTQYFFAFVLPWHRDHLHDLVSADEMIATNDLHTIAEPLRANPRLRVFANHNDFLTSDEDVEWLSSLLGPERVHFFPTGGHLGNLHRPEVQTQMLETLDDLRAPAAP